MKATLSSSQTDAVAAQAGLNTALAQLNSSKADLAQKRLDFGRAEGLYKDQLISKADYDAKRAAHEVAEALYAQDQARVGQNRAQVDSAHAHVNQMRAPITRLTDVLRKTGYAASFDGVVHTLPVPSSTTLPAP